MKIAVVSDTHGNIEKTLDAIRTIENLELIIHLGDHVLDAREIEKQIAIDTIYVKGNCDLEKEVYEEKILDLLGKKILITHGHNYDVKRGLNNIFYRGKELNVDVILFGHSHISLIMESENILMLNPGSPDTPRNGKYGSIGLLEISNNEIKSQIIYV